ncbi:MAG TPA: TonB-dependent receptor [Longimicrobiales bacterium]|nr:TonB-dependent receptor [Longimicrobiales bacterium]
MGDGEGVVVCAGWEARCLGRATRAAGTLRVATAVLVATMVYGGEAAAQTPVPELDTLDVTVASRVSPALSVRTRTVAVLTREEIESVPARTVGDLLRWMNGVELQERSGAQADLSLRGAGFEQVLVLVDGVRVSDAQSGHFDLDLAVPVDRIRRIEVLRGPGSALFGADAVGGVVNIVTRDAAGDGDVGLGPVRTAARAEGGSFGSWRLSATEAVPLGHAGIHLGQEWAASDGGRAGTDYRNLVLQGAVDAPLGGGRVELSAGHAARDFGAADFYAPIPSWEETRTTRTTAGWTSGRLAGLGLEARASVRDHDDRFVFYRDEPEAGSNVHDARQVGAELVLRRSDSRGALSFAAGAEAWRDELDSSNLGDRSESRTALWGEVVLRASGQGVVTAGVRADDHEAWGGFVSPSLSAAWDLTPSVRLQGSLARSFRAPTWTDRYYADPFHQASADIVPEEAWSWEAGVRMTLAPGLTVGAAAFRRSTENLIDWARPDGSGDNVKWRTRNVEEADFTGLELDASGMGPERFRWQAGAFLMGVDVTGEKGFFSKRALRPETRRLTLGLSRKVGGAVKVALHGLWAGRRSERAYHRIDLRVSAEVAAFLAPGTGAGTVYLDVTNLTDQDHLDASGQPVPGLGVVVGWRIGA